MTKVYFCDKDSLYKELETALRPHICGNFNIARTESGKPYVDGNPVYFSLSHCENDGVFAISDKPVGVDLELFRNRKFKAVLSRFTMREREEIDGDLEKFLKNWVIKEAYVKMCGSTLANALFKLEYFGGRLYFDGTEAECEITVKNYENRGVYAICAGELK